MYLNKSAAIKSLTTTGFAEIEGGGSVERRPDGSVWCHAPQGGEATVEIVPPPRSVYLVIIDDPRSAFGPRYTLSRHYDRDAAFAAASAERLKAGQADTDDSDYCYVVKETEVYCVGTEEYRVR